MIRINDQEFKELVTYIKSKYGINLENKRILIEGRLASVLLEKQCKDFSAYIALLKRDRTGAEVTLLLNKITTNHTFFMRESKHFSFLKEVILPEQEKNNRRKNFPIWSAGCSVGAEAYTTMMTLYDYFGVKKSSWTTKILATDISESVLAKAREGIYAADLVKEVPPNWRKQYFTPVADNNFQVIDKIRREIEFKTLNLMEDFRFASKFQLIFCRNVMIYFDQETRRRLVNKFYDVLEPGGYLFIGHSETITRETSKFKYIMPAIYQKVDD